jgi:hypothetical protein
MDDYYAKQAEEERGVTRILMYVWIAEMAWVSFFGMRSVTHPNTCSLGALFGVTLLFSLNYIVPFWFLLQGLGLLVIGKADDARAAFKDGIAKIVRWYKAAPTLTFVALGLLLWTAYNVSFRYHVTLDYRDSYSDDLAQVQTTKDSLTGDVTQRTFSEEACYEAWDREHSP